MKKPIYFFSAVVFCLALTACKTVKEIPEDLSAAQLIQLGQTAYGNASYKNAEKYYETTIERYGDDVNTYIEAKYELAHLYLKQKNYKKAYAGFDELLELYSYASAGDLPGAYKRLAQIGMEKIPENKRAEYEAAKQNAASPSEAE